MCYIDYDKIHTFSLVNLYIERVVTRGHQNVSLNRVVLDPFHERQKQTKSEMKGLILIRFNIHVFLLKIFLSTPGHGADKVSILL